MWIFAELMLCDNLDHPVELLAIHEQQEATTNDFKQAVDSFANYTDVKEDVNYSFFIAQSRLDLEFTSSRIPASFAAFRLGLSHSSRR